MTRHNPSRTTRWIGLGRTLDDYYLNSRSQAERRLLLNIYRTAGIKVPEVDRPKMPIEEFDELMGLAPCGGLTYGETT